MKAEKWYMPQCNGVTVKTRWLVCPQLQNLQLFKLIFPKPFLTSQLIGNSASYTIRWARWGCGAEPALLSPTVAALQVLPLIMTSSISSYCHEEEKRRKILPNHSIQWSINQISSVPARCPNIWTLNKCWDYSTEDLWIWKNNNEIFLWCIRTLVCIISFWIYH